MSEVQDTIHVNVEYYTGLEDPDDVGYPYYVAAVEGVENLIAITDGTTWSELMRNIHEMLMATFEGEDMADYNLTPNPRIVIRMELPENYAEIA